MMPQVRLIMFSLIMVDYSTGWGGVVAHEILVSAQGPLVLGFGAKGLGPGVDNCSHLYIYILRYKEYY